MKTWAGKPPSNPSNACASDGVEPVLPAQLVPRGRSRGGGASSFASPPHLKETT